MAKTNLSKLQENFTCLAIVCVDHIKLPLMDILDNHIKPPDLYYEINSSTLISANKLRPDQKKLCYITPPGIPDYSKFDVTLLYTLIRNLCSSLKPSGWWGEEPAASHTQLGDDIERLRLFRNEQFAHANSAEISDGEFNKLWTDLQTVINRIQSNKKAGCKTDYLQTFKSIEKRLLNWDDLEKYKLLLEATIHASKQREDMDGPDIWIEGSEEAVCGSSAHFQANVKERKVSFLSVSWKKLIKNESTPIDTSNKKFWGKTNKELFIESVCKEDEGEYQAVISFEEDRIGTTIKSNVICLRVVGGIPTVTTSHETCLQTHSVKLIGNVFVIDDLPVIDEIYWTKNGNKIDTQVNEGKYSNVSVDNPSLTIYNVNQYDAGHYTLTATNAAGTTVSDTIVLGAPDIVLGESKEESDGSQIFTVTITSIPAAYNIQWQVSGNNSDMFTILDENAEEYRGTSHSVPHPVLVVRLKEHLKNNKYQIEVQNFVGGRRKKIPSILNIFYKDRGAGVMFAKLFNEVVELFPERKLNQLQDLTIDSCKDKDKDLPPLIKTATSAREYFRILKDKELFTPSDVIFMQFLLRESHCGLLNDKCIAYAKTQKALCFYEEPPRNGYKKVQFHVQGNISNYTTDQIGIIKETVVAIVGCEGEDIHLDGFLNSDSFFVVLSMTERYVNGLFNMNQQDKEKLVNLNIDYFIIDSDHINLKNPKDEPQICIKGAEEVLCGETTHFDAVLKQFDSQTWSMYWQKTREKTTKQIDTKKDKYKNSSNLRLTVNLVSKEDEGEYQVVLARKHNGGDYKLCSNRIYLTPIGEKPYFNSWKITTGKEKITIYYSYKISERSPKVLKLEWTKNGENLETNSGKCDGGGLNDGYFILKSPIIDDIGSYTCTVTNAVGSASEHADFDLPIASISTNSGTYFGSNTIITSRISSCPSLEGVEWQKSVDGNTFNCIDISQPRYKGSSIEPESPLLVIPKTTFEDKLHYRLLVWNIFGQCISDPLYLIVTGSPPNVFTSHRIYFEHQAVKLIGTVFVSENSPAVHEVFWTKNGEKIVTSKRGGRYSEVSVDHPSLTINSVNSHDIGAYQLTAINAVGSTASDTIFLDEPRICVERKENPDSSHCFIAQIQSVPAAYHSQWMVKGKDDDTFKPVDINDEEFKGSSNALPRPILVVKHNQLLEENCFVIEVQNFVGRKTHCFAGRGHLKTSKCKRMSTEALIDKKLGDVNSFCESWGFNVGDIINSIKLNAQELPEMALATIDVLFESSKSQQLRKDKNVIITAVNILGKVLMLVGSPVHVTGVSSDVVRLVDCFLNIFFRVCNPSIKAMLDLGDSTTDGYDYVDLAERFKTFNIFLNEQELTENFDEPDLSDVIANIDIYIGIDEIGIVQNRIKEMMYGPRDQSQSYLNYLKVFLRICTFRHVLLFRVMNCLIARQYFLRTVNTLRNFIEKERVDNRCFLKFFSLPNLESTEIVAEFEPSQHTELAAYLREVRLPFQDLREILHDRIFLIQSFVNPFVFLARQNSIFSNAVTLTFTKRGLSTDNNQFKFIAKDNSFNLFYIQSPNSDKCVYVEGNTIKQGHEAMHRAAQWRVVQVYRSDGGDKTASCFVICAKQSPNIFVYLKKDRKCLVNHSKPNDECLFVLIPIGESPILVSRPMESNLTDELQDMPSFTPMKSRNVQIRITNFRKIKIFLQKEHAMIANDIDQIETYILCEGVEELTMLNPLLEKIAKTVDSIKGDNFDEHTMHALQQMISICCQYFLDEFPFGSILRQLLRLCGVLISCMWHAHGIDKLFCSLYSDSDIYCQLAIQKDVRCLQQVAFLLNEIERCENIQEKHISYIMNKDKFLVKLRSLASLRETAKATHNPQMMVTCLKLSILQLAVMWQKFAITKYPGHSDNYAKKLRQIIQSEMTEDVCLMNKFNEKRQCQRCTKIAVDLWLVDDYVSCLGCDLPNDRERRTRRNLKKMFLVVVPLLKRIFQRSPERYTQLDNPN